MSGAIAVTLLLPANGSGQRIRELPLLYLVGCGGLFVSYMLLLFLAVGPAEGRQQVLEVGLLNYLWPALTILLSVTLLKKRASLLLFPATLLALSGVALVLTQGAATYLAYALWDTAMRTGNVVLVAAGSYLTPFFSTVVTCVYLAIPARPSLWMGCSLLVIGSLLSWVSVSEVPARRAHER